MQPEDEAAPERIKSGNRPSVMTFFFFFTLKVFKNENPWEKDVTFYLMKAFAPVWCLSVGWHSIASVDLSYAGVEGPDFTGANFRSVTSIYLLFQLFSLTFWYLYVRRAPGGGAISDLVKKWGRDDWDSCTVTW